MQEFAQEIERQNKSKRDFVVSAPKLKAYSINDQLEVAFALKEQTETDADFYAGKLTATGHDQMATWTGIPKPYYQMMMGNGNTELLAKNIQWWTERSTDRRMIRTLDGNVRGVLSDRYRRLDNHELLTAMLPILLEMRADIKDCEITDRKLYLKFIIHQIEGEVKKGDIVTLGGIISNSEIGFGSLNIQPLVLRKVCDNGLIINELATKKYHVGRKVKDDVIDINYSDETNTALDKAFWLTTRDTIKEVASQVTMDKVLKRMKASAGMVIKDPQVAMELTSTKLNLNETESNSVLTHLINGGDLTNWGMLNAVTRAAQDVESYDRSIELESLASMMLSMNLN